MNIIQYYSVNNDCYKNNVNKTDSRYTSFQKNGPKGLMLHSVGCSQPSAKVFANSWNKSNKEVAVHAVLQADGTVYQCLPWNYRGWHAGGNANNTHIGVEMTEPDCITYTSGSKFTCSNKTKAVAQVKGTYETAVELFAYLCKLYGLNPTADGVIISHAEGYKRGVASNHGDPEHLWNGLSMGYTMDGFRKDVKAKMSGISTSTSTSTSTSNNTSSSNASSTLYRVRKSWTNPSSQIGAYSNLSNAKAACDKAGSGYYVFNSNGTVVYPTTSTSTTTSNSSTSSYLIKVTASVLNIRKGPGTNYAVVGSIKNGGKYTIVAESTGAGATKWGKLKSGAGWISLDYVTKV